MKKMPASALVIADIEGTVGIYDKRQCKQNSRQWEDTRKMVTEDINAVIKGISQAGVENITIKDMHNTGYNILPQKLEKKVVCMQGHYWRPVPMFGKIPVADLAIMTGWHSAPDQPDGFSPHIFHKRIRQVKINDTPVTEVELFAALLGEYNIPVAFVTADKVGLDRIKANLPWVSALEIPKHKLTQKEELVIRKKITSEIYLAIKNFQEFSSYKLGNHIVEVVLDDSVIRWNEESAVETLRKVMAIAVLKETPEVLHSSVMALFRFHSMIRELSFTIWNR